MNNELKYIVNYNFYENRSSLKIDWQLSYDTGVYQAGFETLGQLFDLQTESNFGFVKRLNRGKVEHAFRISL